MKVLIHAIGADIGGGRRHIEALLPALERVQSRNTFVVFVRKGVLENFKSSKIEVRRFSTRLCSTGMKRFYFDQVILPRIVKNEGFDVCISILNFGPIFCPAKHVIFQRNALYFDEEYISIEPVHRRIRNRIRRLLIGFTIRNCDLVVSPSLSMDKLVKHFYGTISEEKFAVLYHGFDKGTLKKNRGDFVKPKSGYNKDYISIFYPAHFARHKGFNTLVEAAKLLVDHNINFNIYVTVSHDYWPSGFARFGEQIRSPELRSCILNLGNISQSEIGELYRSSDVIFFPSLCESFGLPLIEAMGYAKPLVASDIDVNREICGEAAKYFYRNSAKDAASCLEYFVDPSCRAEFSEKSAKRFSRRDWSWETYARSLDCLLNKKFGELDSPCEVVRF